MRNYPIALIVNDDEQIGRYHCQRVSRIQPQAQIIWVRTYIKLDVSGATFEQVVNPDDHLSWVEPEEVRINWTDLQGGLVLADYEAMARYTRPLLFRLRHRSRIVAAAEAEHDDWNDEFVLEHVAHAKLIYPLTDQRLIQSIEVAERRARLQ